jgi:hypothetical protein
MRVSVHVAIVMDIHATRAWRRMKDEGVRTVLFATSINGKPKAQRAGRTCRICVARCRGSVPAEILVHRTRNRHTFSYSCQSLGTIMMPHISYA